MPFHCGCLNFGKTSLRVGQLVAPLILAPARVKFAVGQQHLRQSHMRARQRGPLRDRAFEQRTRPRAIAKRDVDVGQIGQRIGQHAQARPRARRQRAPRPGVPHGATPGTNSPAATRRNSCRSATAATTRSHARSDRACRRRRPTRPAPAHAVDAWPTIADANRSASSNSFLAEMRLRPLQRVAKLQLNAAGGRHGRCRRHPQSAHEVVTQAKSLMNGKD